MPDHQFTVSLGMLAQALAGAADDWWIIGSAAVALHGGDPGTIADMDVIVSRRDIDALYERLPLADTPDESKAMFRSQRFGLWSEPPMPVEFMACLELLTDGSWAQVQPQTRQSVQVDGLEIFVPERDDLIAILQRFGREKDLRRAATLLK